ncbi:hypothetical protein XENORESO_020469 [Xenotaenia resolanae]|uniref:Uncharacterized protein n=1 Tax=Xenotaenia resolanae TaxID=208358 RepID=A0ABV0WAS8_9TELE
MNLPTFLYQTDFQLSSSSGNGLVERKFACKLLSLQICASVASSRETRWKWQRKFIFRGFIIPGDVRAAMSVELHMFNCVTKMDDSNIGNLLVDEAIYLLTSHI